MGGRGQGRGGISGPQRGIKDDNSEVTFSNRTVTATENVVKALGEENLESMADYINGAIERVTGLDDFLTLNLVDGASGNTYAWMDWNGTMGINGKLFKNVDKLSQTYVEDVLAGFHPKGTDFNDVAVHEAGHFLDRKLTQMLGNQLQDWERASTPIVRTALDNLEKIEIKSESESSKLPVSQTNVMALSSANFQWSYTVSQGIDARPLAELIDEVRNLNKRPYTSESVQALNKALLNAQKTLRASVVVSQSVLQMLLGGAIGESLGNIKSLGNTISHSMFAMILAGIPLVCFMVLCFDKRSHLKHIICMVGAIVCLAVIFAVLYPFVGRGAVLSIILYIIIFILNLSSIYAKQQEDYIIKHPEKEPEFTEKHPHFVKALINYKAFVKYAAEPQVKPKNKKKKK